MRLQGDTILTKQFNKRICWDRIWNLNNQNEYYNDDIYQFISSIDMFDHINSIFKHSSIFNAVNNQVCIDQFLLLHHQYLEGFSVNNKKLIGKSSSSSNPTLCNYQCYMTPALSLFHRNQSDLGIVFRTRVPLLTCLECRNIINYVNKYHQTHYNGIWGTVRQSNVKTTDVAVESIPLLRNWLITLLHSKIFPLLSMAFPVLSDGSVLFDPITGDCRVRVHDAFIVRYDAEVDKSCLLPEHCDTSAMSVILSLNSEEEGEYTGGGTWFEALGENYNNRINNSNNSNNNYSNNNNSNNRHDINNGKVINAEKGHAVLFAGPLRHAGYPVTKGVRHILVLFLYVEGFHYGPLLKGAVTSYSDNNSSGRSADNNDNNNNRNDNNIEASDISVQNSDSKFNDNDHINPSLLSSGGVPGGYVVYRETVELVDMLKNTYLDE